MIKDTEAATENRIPARLKGSRRGENDGAGCTQGLMCQHWELLRTPSKSGVETGDCKMQMMVNTQHENGPHTLTHTHTHSHTLMHAF